MTVYPSPDTMSLVGKKGTGMEKRLAALIAFQAGNQLLNLSLALYPSASGEIQDAITEAMDACTKVVELIDAS